MFCAAKHERKNRAYTTQARAVTPVVDYKQVSYKCPKCKKQNSKGVPYIPGVSFSSPDKAKITLETRCSTCNSPHRFTYTIKANKDKLSIFTHEFLCSGEQVKKRLKIKNPDEKSGN